MIIQKHSRADRADSAHPGASPDNAEAAHGIGEFRMFGYGGGGGGPAALVRAAENSLGHDLAFQPAGSPFAKTKVEKHLGCAESVCNLLLMSNHHFRVNDFRIDIDSLESTLRGKFGAYRLNDLSGLRPGDVLIGRGGPHGSRHVGVVGGMENGVRMVFHNRNGRLVKEPLAERFGEYRDVYALRMEH